MVISNHVLTGRVSYHRNLEHAVLELTLFKTVPSKMQTHSPPPPPRWQDCTSLLHTLGQEKVTGHSLEPDFCSLWIVAKKHSVNCEVGNTDLYSFLIKGSSVFLVWGLEVLWGKHIGVLWAFWLCCLHGNTQSDLSGCEANAFMVKTVFAHHFHLLHCVTWSRWLEFFPS